MLTVVSFSCAQQFRLAFTDCMCLFAQTATRDWNLVWQFLETAWFRNESATCRLLAWVLAKDLHSDSAFPQKTEFSLKVCLEWWESCVHYQVTCEFPERSLTKKRDEVRLSFRECVALSQFFVTYTVVIIWLQRYQCFQCFLRCPVLLVTPVGLSYRVCMWVCPISRTTTSAA